MFKQQKRREERSRMAAQKDREIERLKAEVTRLETALQEAIAASEDVLIDLRRVKRERAQLVARAASGFADAWLNSDDVSSGVEDFFTDGQVDKRARRWLLSTS